MEMLSFDTNDAFQNNYKFLIGSIVPRPIALVSTRNLDGSTNVAPFSFFTAVSAKPMVIAFSPLIRTATGKEKDTPVNIKREKEFVINFVDESIINDVNLTSTELEYGQSELELTSFSTIDSEIIKTQRVAESPIQYECRFLDTLSYGEDLGGGQIITGEVVKVHVRSDLYDNGRINENIYKPVGRGAGLDWIKCTDKFQLERLMKAQIQK
jgi:flavin reductase (DIM6/NTAB) family NADH-FMN oxidoreductase RutF